MGLEVAAFALSAVAAGGQYMGAQQQADAQREAAAWQALQHEGNAKIAEINAGLVLKKGEEEQELMRKKGNVIGGAQRAALAAQGIDVTQGSSVEIQEDTQAQIMSDIAKIKTNAVREAWGYRMEAHNQRTSAMMGRIGAESAASATMLGAGFRAIGQLSEAGYSAYKGSK